MTQIKFGPFNAFSFFLAFTFFYEKKNGFKLTRLRNIFILIFVLISIISVIGNETTDSIVTPISFFQVIFI